MPEKPPLGKTKHRWLCWRNQPEEHGLSLLWILARERVYGNWASKLFTFFLKLGVEFRYAARVKWPDSIKPWDGASYALVRPWALTLAFGFGHVILSRYWKDYCRDQYVAWMLQWGWWPRRNIEYGDRIYAACGERQWQPIITSQLLANITSHGRA